MNDEILNVFNNDEKLSSQSKQNYANNVFKIYQLNNNLIDHNKTIKLLSENFENLETRRTYLNSLIKYLELTKKPTKELIKYKLELKKQIIEQSNTKKIKQNNYTIEYDELQKLLDILQNNLIESYGSVFCQASSSNKIYLKQLTKFMLLYCLIKYQLNCYNLKIKDLYIKDDLIINEYIKYLQFILNKDPEYLYLYVNKNGIISLFNKPIVLSHLVPKIIKSIYPTKHITIATIKKTIKTYNVNNGIQSTTNLKNVKPSQYKFKVDLKRVKDKSNIDLLSFVETINKLYNKTYTIESFENLLEQN